MKWAPALIVVAAFCVFAYISAHKPAGDEKQPDAAAPAAAGHAVPVQAQEGAPAHGAAPSNAAAASSEPAAKGSPAVVPAMKLLPPPPRNPDSVFGHVRAPSGRGLAQARVALIGADGREVAATTTGPDGRYAFDLVKPATYTVVATDPDFLYTVSEPATAVAEKGKAVEADVTMKRGAARISGVVLDFAGKPVADQKIEVTAGGAAVAVNTDSKGHFLVNGLVDGTWTVTPAGRTDLAVKIATTGLATAMVVIALVKKASLEIQVRGTKIHPVSIKKDGATAFLRPAGKSDDASTRRQEVVMVEETDGRKLERDQRFGRVAYGELDPGEYELEIADHKGTSILTGLPQWTTPTPITLEEGQSRVWPLTTALSARGLGVEVPFGWKCFMFIAIALMIFVTPILFPAPAAPKRPPSLPTPATPATPAAPAAH